MPFYCPHSHTCYQSDQRLFRLEKSYRKIGCAIHRDSRKNFFTERIVFITGKSQKSIISEMNLKYMKNSKIIVSRKKKMSTELGTNHSSTLGPLFGHTLSHGFFIVHALHNHQNLILSLLTSICFRTFIFDLNKCSFIDYLLSPKDSREEYDFEHTSQ